MSDVRTTMSSNERFVMNEVTKQKQVKNKLVLRWETKINFKKAFSHTNKNQACENRYHNQN